MNNSELKYDWFKIKFLCFIFVVILPFVLLAEFPISVRIVIIVMILEGYSESGINAELVISSLSSNEGGG